MNELALFAGAGGGILGGKLLGWRTVCAVEIEPYAASVLVARQNDGLLPPFPIWDDVRTFDGKPWHGIVDVVSGGFPCQDISCAGKGKGISGERSGLWKEMARIVDEVRPMFVFIENSPMLRTRGLSTVLKDLAEMGYDARWGVLGAHNAGAPHKRDRMWILAYAKRKQNNEIWENCKCGWDELGRYKQASFENNGKANSNCTCGLCIHVSYSDRKRKLQPKGVEQDERGWFGNVCKEISDANDKRLERQREKSGRVKQKQYDTCDNSWWSTEPDVGRVADGVAARVDRLKAIGNGQVPAVVALAWKTLTNDLEEER